MTLMDFEGWLLLETQKERDWIAENKADYVSKRIILI